MATVTFAVPDMHCEGCAATVQDALEGVDGVSDVSVDVAGKNVTAEYDPAQTSPDLLRSSIKNVGFEPELRS